MATYSATGITLIVRKYKGTQRLASFYTRERGKVEAVVSGVGKPGSKLAPAVEPLTLSKLFFAEGRNLDRLTQCEVIDSFYDLRKDLRRLALASYTAELVCQTTEVGEAEPPVFDALAETLAAMTHGEQPELMAWGFVLRYLAQHGIAPSVELCASCGREIEGAGHYITALGGCACERCRVEEGADGGDADRRDAHDRRDACPTRVLSPQARGAMRTLTRLDADKLDRIKLTPRVEGEIREVLRQHIRYHMGVSLKSEAFMGKMGGGRQESGVRSSELE